METRSERAWEVVGPRFRFLLSVTLMTALAVVGLTAIPGILANGYPAQGLHRLTLERLQKDDLSSAETLAQNPLNRASAARLIVLH